jgi:hypothetical protein
VGRPYRAACRTGGAGRSCVGATRATCARPRYTASSWHSRQSL